MLIKESLIKNYTDGLCLYNRYKKININSETELMNGVNNLFIFWRIVEIARNNMDLFLIYQDEENTTRGLNRYDFDLIKDMMNEYIEDLCILYKGYNYEEIWKGYNLRIENEKVGDYYE
jgi:hypothetical protein